MKRKWKYHGHSNQPLVSAWAVNCSSGAVASASANLRVQSSELDTSLCEKLLARQNRGALHQPEQGVGTKRKLDVCPLEHPQNAHHE